MVLDRGDGRDHGTIARSQIPLPFECPAHYERVARLITGARSVAVDERRRAAKDTHELLVRVPAESVRTASGRVFERHVVVPGVQARGAHWSVRQRFDELPRNI